MKFYWLLLPFFLISLWGCMPVIKIIYGIHQPRVQNEDKLKKYLGRIEANTANNYAISPAGYTEILGYIKSTFPEIMVFNQKGNLIPYKEYKACNASAVKFIEMLDTSNHYQIADSVHLAKLFKNFTTLDGETAVFNVNNAGFTLLIFWTEFTGRLNKENTVIWEKAAAKNNKSQINVYKINCDLQENWSKEERQRIIDYLNETFS